ncbi:FMN-linked oxidoreductase [Aspergillus uvarum CBS 121591]|uniref:FMN-linked oxidoreductase n=1 Tax=Aspergillus uvarum CBS 121591 TaxID=1448315 RepID=A0A319C9A3_9EURO|nr:FMN-linked oxidoreductase [Aspergillus uvarum CBS 121591]PYH80559.1 FMN-linked oxidoreductase [Aspergillus uvarum CBS 121591]
MFPDSVGNRIPRTLQRPGFEKVARDQLSPKSWAFNTGAANDNLTRGANQTMLQRVWLRPAIMRDISTVTTYWTLLGCQFTVLVYTAPVDAAKSVCGEAELPLARAAYKAGILYINRDRRETEAQIRQATASGKVKGFLITADLSVMFKREADERLKPGGGRGLVVSINEQQQPLGGPSMNANASLAKSNSSFIDPTLNWQEFPWLRSITELPLLIKGVQRAEDAHLALHYGLDNIVVSNHGGRAADTAPPSILTLLEIRRNCPEAFEEMIFLVDGGFRRGSDVVKAVCLEASVVGLGRPFTYALTYGEPGVLHAIEVLKKEVETAMQLIGLTDLRDASPRYINTATLDRLLPPNNGRPEALATGWTRAKL